MFGEFNILTLAELSMRHYIYQICYSERTQLENDTGFLSLNNLANERPDWREYWPMRNFLLQTRMLAEESYYGFLSPKFYQKTGLRAAQVQEFLDHSTEDVVHFSPFFDQAAFPLNVFEQASAQHSGVDMVMRESMAMLAPNVDIYSLVMDSSTTVFCNYFVARPAFWRLWLDKCELLYALAEENCTDLARRLNAPTNHDGGTAPAKVFVIERVASLLLTLDRSWTVRGYNPLRMPFATSPIASFRDELCVLNAMKGAYIKSGHPEYLSLYLRGRQSIVQQFGAAQVPPPSA